jgi:RHS repeat-associated protein
VKQFAYTEDNRLAGVSYANPVNPTPSVSFAYDPYFPRAVSMTDGNGTTQYAYVPAFAFGGLQPQQECFTPNGASSCAWQIAYAYDALGRFASRTVGGAGPETIQYDAIGRPTQHASDLGQFALSYLGETGQITRRQLLPSGSNLSTSWSYLPNSGDRRLSGISNAGLAAGQLSTYQYTTSPESFITAITETSDTPAVYPAVSQQTASYNNLNQLTVLSGQALTYDAVGNLLSDGQRNYRWDAENRLVGIAYPGQAGKATAFTYDGLGRRVTITSTPTGGSATTTNYVWCSTRICQARNALNMPVRGYYAEGELVAGSPSQPYYYGPDQIGSVRRVFASATSAPAYSFDAYGNALQGTAPLTDFGYAGMFYNADSGLYLTRYRAYDPVAGRWLSRDPAREATDPEGNLYAYVGGNPISARDPSGLLFNESVARALGRAAGVVAAGGGPENPAADAIALGVAAGTLIGEGIASAIGGSGNGDQPPPGGSTGDCGQDGGPDRTPPFRAVSPAELDSIQSSNTFTNPPGIDSILLNDS